MKKNITIFLIIVCCAMTLTACDNTWDNNSDNQNHTHDYGNWMIVNYPTCTEYGLEERVCSICHTVDRRTIYSYLYNYSDWDIDIEATCTSDGRKVKECLNCGHKEYQTYTVGHDFLDATCALPKMCKYCGLAQGYALGHDEGADGKCIRCGKVLSVDMRTRLSAPLSGFGFGKSRQGMIELHWSATNNTDKVINYVWLTVNFYNRVGDPAFATRPIQSFIRLKIVGPISSGGIIRIDSHQTLFVTECYKIEIGKIELEYSDGTYETGWYGYETTNLKPL